MSIPTDHSYGFDPTHGMGLDALRALRAPAAPSGFREFWEARYRRALAVEPRPRLSPDSSDHPDWRVFDLAFTSTDGCAIGGWLLLPRRGEVRRGLVVGHGYGGREAPDLDLPVEATALLFPCCRGLSRSRHPAISANPAWHVLHDIDKPERYVLGGCVEDLWLAVSALLALHPEIAGRVGYSGISFGGGIGALALAFDARLDRGQLTVPTFGNMPLWLSLPSIGSAAAVQAYRRRHPEVAETLAFFDAASAATLITVPMLVAPARFDPAVAPPCQFSIANALASSSLHESFILDAGHTDYPGMADQGAMLRERVGEFFRAP
ncbi:deacetylase [Aureimonas endophytica]|uniref:Deacetylase n=1 Tax=Aureimonas endophytica TaxID=2027858 RepID=A0A917ECQ3_9HYPH|nr:acetylxylan esterase [Aureimonas endophytica]GGE22757.1 deacetylase [Aureimonas endophytica]